MLKQVTDALSAMESEGNTEAKALMTHYRNSIEQQPAEQLGGVKTTLANYLQYFTDPAIAEVFCPLNPGINFDVLDEGKIICVSIPQRYQMERRYINTLLKLAFYTHTLRRFESAGGVTRER